MFGTHVFANTGCHFAFLEKSLSLFSLTKVTDEGVLVLASLLPSLESLDLCGTKVTDNCLESLSSLSRLSQLKLSGNDLITIAGVPWLCRLPALDSLEVRCTMMSKTILGALGVEQGQVWWTESLPAVTVRWW